MVLLPGFKTLHDIAKLSSEDLDTEIRSIRYEYAVLRAKKNSGELKQPHLLREYRRYIARLLTFRQLLIQSV